MVPEHASVVVALAMLGGVGADVVLHSKDKLAVTRWLVGGLPSRARFAGVGRIR